MPTIGKTQREKAAAKREEINKAKGKTKEKKKTITVEKNGKKNR